MLAELNKVLVYRMIEAVYNQGNLDAIPEFFALGYVGHHGKGWDVAGLDAVTRAVRMQRAAFPNLYRQILKLIAEDELVVVRGVDIGTHLGTYLGYAPTGQIVSTTWVMIFRVESGCIVESWLETDQEALNRQLSGDAHRMELA